MPKFIVRELQRVLAVREVEADSEEEAYALFCEGEGVPVGKDGDVRSSDLLDVTESEGN